MSFGAFNSFQLTQDFCKKSLQLIETSHGNSWCMLISLYQMENPGTPWGSTLNSYIGQIGGDKFGNKLLESRETILVNLYYPTKLKINIHHDLYLRTIGWNWANYSRCINLKLEIKHSYLNLLKDNNNNNILSMIVLYSYMTQTLRCILIRIFFCWSFLTWPTNVSS